MARRLLYFGLFWGLSFFGAAPLGARSPDHPPVYKPVVAAEYPHHSGHFTQGLFFHQGRLYESTGLYGRSALYIKDPQSGQTLKSWLLDKKYFGEGSTVLNDTLYLLTWRENTGFILAPQSLDPKTTFTYPGEGWGLTSDGRRLIRSDGSQMLHFTDAQGREIKRLAVTAAGQPLERLNELEWWPAGKLILANIWEIPRVAAIDPENGQVRFWLDLGDLKPFGPQKPPEGAVANGLALDPGGDFLWLTGKLWPKMYKIHWPPVDVRPVLTPEPGRP